MKELLFDNIVEKEAKGKRSKTRKERKGKAEV